MSEELNKKVVRRYFEEVIDGGNRAAMAELFAPGAVQHFPGRDVRVEGGAGGPSAASRTMKTTLHNLLADGDLVAAHLTHDVSFAPETRFQTRVGSFDVGGRSVRWDAMALFRLEDGKIVEEWVNRDELAILDQLGVIDLKPA
ncbi:MAG TPA: nuclear transport factor 2 family protein [Dehalococcoidia bacterium]|nr:nuclear transport factor 2 family protein [Dehalococcoidia bacterium]